jgi:hypothetical protein
MTTYTTTAIATNSVDNTLTVASISNMVPGLPITFSGVTFGGITAGSTYYIGSIAYGYPASSITLTSLPGGAVFALTTAVGSMTAAWSSGGQQMISTIPPGENLNTAFTKINTNFDQLWAAGPVGSNVRITKNTIYTLDTNGDLILNPNGTGNVVGNAHVIPDTTLIRNLGSPSRIWNEAYINYLSVGTLAPAEFTIPVGNLHILGGTANAFLKTDGNGNLSWGLPIAAAGGNTTQIQYNNNGVLDGSNTFTFASNTSTVTIQNVTTTGRSNLNSVGNVQISGGTAGYVLQTDGTGNLSWTAPTGNITSILDQQIFGDGATVDFTLVTPSVTNAVIVSINGVMQIPGVAYTVTGSTISFTEAPLSSDLIDIRFLVFGSSSNNTPGGATGFIQFNSGGGFGGSGNLRYSADTGNLYSSNISVGGNVTASYYLGDGSQLTGITAVADTGTITFANNVISTSNANTAISIVAPQSTPVGMATGGNSATGQLLWATNIGALTPDQINNGVLGGNTWGTQISVGNTGAVIGSNSVVGLRTWTFGTTGTLSGTGGIMAGNISSAGTVVASGNVSGDYILGNVAFATGIPQSYGNSNVYALLNGSAANIIPLANVSYSLGNATHQWKELWVSNSTIYMNSVPITLGAGNVLSVAGNAVVTTTGSSTSLGNIGFNGNTIYDINGVNLENSDPTHGHTAGVFIPANGNTNAIVLNNTYGNVVLQAGSNSNTTAAWTFRNTGNVSLPGGGLLGNTYGDNPNSVGLQAGPGGYAGINSNDQGQFVQADATGVYIGTDYTGNSCIWTFDASGNITLPGNASSINYANGQPYGGTGGNPFDQDLNTANSVTFASVSATGNVNSGNIRTGQISATGNVSAGNLHTGQITATGNISTTSGNISGANYITGNFFVGDGSGLSNISVSANTGNITFDNSTLVGPSFGVAPSANSSVYIQPTVDSATRYQFGVGSLAAPGNISAVGNVTGTYILGNGSQLTGLPATYGNSNVTTLLSAFGSNTVSTTGNITSGNILTGGIVSATGNITGNYILGNGSQLTGLPATYGNSNVTTLLGAFGSNNISTTGTITAGNTSTSGNAQIGTTLVIVGATNSLQTTNGSAVQFGNRVNFNQTGTSIVASGNISGTNIQGSTLSASGNVTGGNLILSAGGQITTPGGSNGNVSINPDGTGQFIVTAITPAAFGNTLSVTGNVTTANYFVGNLVGTTASVTGNITGNYFFGNGSQLTGLPATYGNANVATFMAAYGSNTISTTGNITAGNLIGNISITGNVTGTSPNVSLVAGSYTWTFDNTGNLTLPTNGDILMTGVNSILSAGGTTLLGGATQAVGSYSTLGVSYPGAGTQFGMTLRPVADNTTAIQFLNAAGNSIGNIKQTSSTVKFVGDGSELSNVAIKTTGTWTVTTGTNTYSITVPASGTYQIWVRGNIPNGIITYLATAVVTNTNVPVVGAQYAWVYNGGGTPIDFTSIPNQFVGTANTIVRSSTAPSATTNRFDFGINNTSGSSQTVYWGYVALG